MLFRSDIMRRPPRPPRLTLFERSDILVAFARGFTGLVGILAVYDYVLGAGMEDGKARAIAFAGVVTVNLALILASRSRRGSLFQSLAQSNPILWLVMAAASAMLLAAVYAAPLSSVFLFAPLDAGELLLALIPAAALLAVSEAMKALQRRRNGLPDGPNPTHMC